MGTLLNLIYRSRAIFAERVLEECLLPVTFWKIFGFQEGAAIGCVGIVGFNQDNARDFLRSTLVSYRTTVVYQIWNTYFNKWPGMSWVQAIEVIQTTYLSKSISSTGRDFESQLGRARSRAWCESWTCSWWTNIAQLHHISNNPIDKVACSLLKQVWKPRR